MTMSEPLWLCVCGATGSPRFQTEVKLFAALRPNVLGSAEATEPLCFVSPLQHTGRQIDLLQSFHSSSNYMKLLVYYRLSEYPAGFIKGAFRRCELSLGKRRSALYE